MLKFKAGVEISKLQPQMVVALMVADAVYAHYGFLTCEFTSGEDGKHKSGTKHADGNAVDLNTNRLPLAANGMRWVSTAVIGRLLAAAIQKQLGENYDVLFEEDEFDASGKQIRWQHIHIEYDPKRMT